MRRVDRGEAARFLLVAGSSLGLATFAVAILQDGLGVPNPSALYLVAVVATAHRGRHVGRRDRGGRVVPLYNFLFVEPRLHAHGRATPASG